MTQPCLKCGGSTEARFRPVMGKGRVERLCPACAGQLSALVQAAGDSCQLSLADRRFAAWVQSGRWLLRSGGSLGPEDLPAGFHAAECPCCAEFSDE